MDKVLLKENEYLGKYVTYMCPGCKHWHTIPYEKRQNNGAVWSFNGNIERPTLSPSIKNTTGPFPDGRTDVCHHHIKEGKIEFCNDCTHELAGQTLDLLNVD